MGGAAARDADVVVSVLGHFELRVRRRPVPVPAGRQRSLLAVLALADGRTVATGRLLDGLWGDDAGGVPALHVLVCRARSVLGAGREALVTEADGYRLDRSRTSSDVRSFRELVATGRRAAALGDDAGAAGALTRAVELWRGPALAGTTSTWSTTAALALEEERVDAEEALLAARLRAGDLAGLVTHARQVLDVHPDREATWAVLVRALHATGRRREAMAALHEVRTTLAGAGLTPGADLLAAEREVASDELASVAPVVPILSSVG